MSNLWQWVVNGLPLLILLGLWLFFMLRMKTGYVIPWAKLQAKQIELLGAQLEALRQTNELLRTLAKAK